jgi:tRNA pseudouridine32 synthase/23S rRNA pseudouridine746 synthase
MVDYNVGKPSLTHYRVVGSTVCGGRRCALVHFTPVTGRTHQLRVHAAHAAGLNCSIVGDALYGVPAERLMLHARSLSFVHPVTGERLVVEKQAPFE